MTCRETADKIAALLNADDGWHDAGENVTIEIERQGRMEGACYEYASVEYSRPEGWRRVFPDPADDATDAREERRLLDVNR